MRNSGGGGGRTASETGEATEHASEMRTYFREGILGVVCFGRWGTHVCGGDRFNALPVLLNYRRSVSEYSMSTHTDTIYGCFDKLGGNSLGALA